MIREVFVPMLGAGADDAALDAAAALAVAHQAHVSAMVALSHPLPVISEMGMIVVEPDARQAEAMRCAAQERARRAGARLAREAVSSEVRVTECFSIWAEQAAALQALHCDLSVLGNPARGTDDDQYFSRMFRGLLLSSGRPVLVAAPTGSGKTFAAFLAAIDGLVRDGLAGTLADETRIVYVSPLKALSNDINRNLAAPLTGISEEQWWQATAPYVDQVFDPEAYPTVARVGPVAGEANQAAYDPYRAFEFGLVRLLDGIAVLVDAAGRMGA